MSRKFSRVELIRLKRTFVHLMTSVLGVYFLPITMANNRRYMFPENISVPLVDVKDSGSLPVTVIPTEIPFVEGLTEVSFSKYHICSDSCEDTLVKVTMQCDGCLTKSQRRSYIYMAKWQLSADVLIAVAYFSIPFELLFFIHKTRVFPYKWVVIQFCSFIVLCGLTHLITVWTFTANSRASFAAMTFFKALTATISFSTAVSMLWVLPELLSVKIRELFLEEKTAELGKEVGKIKKQEEIGRHVRMLTHEIRSTLDRHTILHTTLVELARSLDLQDTGIWMPNLTTSTMELTYEVESHILAAPFAVPMIDETVQQIFSSTGVVVIPRDCDLARLTCSGSRGDVLDGHVAAVKLPLLTTTDFNRDSPRLDIVMSTEGCQALMVLGLPNNRNRQWGVYELDLVNAIVNQIGNAIKFTTTGHVLVSVYVGASAEMKPSSVETAAGSNKRKPLKVQYRYLHIDVQDTGVGVSAENIGRLFNKFVQADSSTTRKFGGTGLGLAICRKFVELMSGTIVLESEGLGRGSTVKIRICVGVLDDSLGERTPPHSAKKLQEPQLTNVKVLVVDDNIINRMVTGRLLRSLGCKAVVLETGGECLKLLSEMGPSAFDLLLLDLCMPEYCADGWIHGGS